MTKLRLYVDEDACEHAVVQGLRARNLDILTTIEADRTGADDRSQLAYSTSVGRAIYTFNVSDFSALHAEYLSGGKSHTGIIVIPDQRCSIGEKIRRIASFVSIATAEEMIDRIAYL